MIPMKMFEKEMAGRITRRDFTKEAVFAGAAAYCTGDLELTPGLAQTAKGDHRTLGKRSPLASTFFKPGKNRALWPLSVPAFRMNTVFIAPPRPGENRENWL